MDVVSAKGEFLGGAIAPGLQISSDAAAARSAGLRRVELTRPRSVIGKNTVECMQAGSIYGFAGLVDGLVRRVRDEVGELGARSPWWPPDTLHRCCWPIWRPSTTMTPTSPWMACGWCSNAIGTVNGASCVRRAERHRLFVLSTVFL